MYCIVSLYILPRVPGDCHTGKLYSGLCSVMLSFYKALICQQYVERLITFKNPYYEAGLLGATIWVTSAKFVERQSSIKHLYSTS